MKRILSYLNLHHGIFGIFICSLAENEECELWMDHILELIKSGLEHRQEARRAGTALAIANMAIQQEDFENTFETLRHDDLNLNERLQNEPVNKRKYQEELFELMEKKKRDNSPWLIHT